MGPAVKHASTDAVVPAPSVVSQGLQCIQDVFVDVAVASLQPPNILNEESLWSQEVNDIQDLQYDKPPDISNAFVFPISTKRLARGLRGKDPVSRGDWLGCHQGASSRL